MTSTSDQIEEWHRDSLEPDRLEYVRRLERTHSRKQQMDSFEASLHGKTLADAHVRQEMAALIKPLLTNELMSMPLVDYRLPTGESRAHIAAGHYLDQVVKRVKDEAKEIDRWTRARYLDNVSLDTLLKDHERRTPEHLFVRELHRLRDRASGTRVVASRRPMDWTDPSLRWLADEAVVRRRVDDLRERSTQLAIDHMERFVARDERRQALDGTRLGLQGRLLVGALERWTSQGAYFALGLPDERACAMEVGGRVTDVKLDLLHALVDATESDFHKRVAETWHESDAKVDYKRVVELIGPMMRNEAANRLCEDLVAWHTVYTEVATPVRRQWAAIDEGLEKLDKTWASLLADAGRLRVPSAVSVGQYRQEQARCYEHAKSLALRATLKVLFEDLKAAMKPPSSLAALTKSYPWREKAEAVLRRDDPVEFAAGWFEPEQAACHEVESLLAPVESEWRARIGGLAEACERVASVMSEKHREWAELERLELARDLFERQLALLPRPPCDDRIKWSTWSALRDAWPNELGPWWRPEEVSIYQPRSTQLISWQDVQRCVLMRTWEECVR